MTDQQTTANVEMANATAPPGIVYVPGWDDETVDELKRKMGLAFATEGPEAQAAAVARLERYRGSVGRFELKPDGSFDFEVVPA